MSRHDTDEALDTLNWQHLVDCDAVEGGQCTCAEQEHPCAA